MKKLILAAFGLSLLASAGAIGQTAPAPAAPVAGVSEVRANTQGFVDFQTATEFLATDLIGQPIVNGAGDTLGTVNNVLFSSDGTIGAVVVGVGGFLGIGVKDVAIAYSAVQTSNEDGVMRFVFNADRDALNNAPAFQPMTTQAPTGPTTPVAVPAVPAELSLPQANIAPVASEPTVTIPPTGTAPPPAAAPAIPAEAPAPVPAAVTAAGATETAREDASGFVAIQAADEILSSDFVGQQIFNAAGDSLGAIDNLLFSRDGHVTAVLVGVGGFLGIGVKEVAIGYDRLNITILDGEQRLIFDATRDALGLAPAFQPLTP